MISLDMAPSEVHLILSPDNALGPGPREFKRGASSCQPCAVHGGDAIWAGTAQSPLLGMVNPEQCLIFWSSDSARIADSHCMDGGAGGGGNIGEDGGGLGAAGGGPGAGPASQTKMVRVRCRRSRARS